MDNKNYHPEPYWTEVAERIDGRTGKNVIAGDDEPFYRYKRARFLEMLNTVDFQNQKVLEIGHGPGGNLSVIAGKNPRELHGVDISDKMIELATKNLKGKKVKLQKINGTSLPFEDNSFDIIFTATVLQHNTDEAMLKKILAEICRVSGNKVVLFERIDKVISGDELCLGRPVNYYEKLCNEHGFQLEEVEYINIHASFLFSGAIRKVLNSSTRQEGEPLNAPSLFLQKVGLPITRMLDKVVPIKRDLAKLVFVKK